MALAIENPALLAALRGLNSSAVMVTVTDLEAAGKLVEHSEALVALALTLALTLDHGAMLQTAPVAKELRATMEALRCDDGSDPDGEFLGSLGGSPLPAEVRDAAKPGKGDVRVAGRGGDGKARKASDSVATPRSRRRA